LNRTILTVDDDVTVTTYVKATLELEGFTVLSAASGPEAVDVAQGTVLDLILLDIQMPGLGGYDVLEALRVVDDTRQIPVMFLTVEDQPDREVLGLRAGVIDYISKSVLHPERVDVLVYRIKNFFAWQENERLRGALSTMVAANHEINNALMVIQGSADILRLKGMLAPRGEAKELLTRIVESGSDIAQVVDKISHLERWESTAYTRGVEMLDLERATEGRAAENPMGGNPAIS
jgi:CheY-like chemotaxis protein